jgi:hypothetical protein
VIVKSPNMDSLAIVGSQAVAIGKAVVNGVGGYSFRGEFVDAGEPGTADRFGLGITDQSGGAVADLSFAAVTLEGGNIQIP